MKRNILVIFIFLFLSLLYTDSTQKAYIPDGFVYVDQVIPTVQLDIRYFGKNNFVGIQIDGYKKPAAILTNEAALALKAVSTELDAKGYYLKIFDGYRPQKAVNHFIRWSKDISDTKMESRFYPNIDKKDLFKFGYLAKKSGHTRGSTVDLTMVYKETGNEVDMGSSFDLLDNISAYNTTLITAEQAKNRDILKNAMQKHGFKPYTREWWHFTLINEPYPNQYFNFDVN